MNMIQRNTVPARGQTGMSLIELMIATTIGMVLLLGAMTVYSQSRATYQVNERIARLQENARFAMSVIEPDLRLANFWGLQRTTNFISGRKDAPDQLGTLVGDCDTRAWIDIDVPIEGANGTNAPYDDCINAVEHADNTDVLLVRHADETATAAPGNGLNLISDRLQGELFVGSAVPAGFGVDAEVFPMVMHTYFVSPQSDTLGNVPSLRRMVLGINSGAPALSDQEVIPGIEDMQVQFGIDVDNDGAVDRYINPDNAMLDDTSPSFVPNARLLAARVWLRVVAETPENAFVDGATYTYADQVFTPPADGLRRLLVSKTIRLRNIF